MKNAVVAIVVVAILAVGGWLIFGNKKSNNSTANNTNQSQTNNTTTQQASNSVTIKDMAFNPANITVKKGTKVTWTNQDSVAHTVTESDSNTGPDSNEIAPGQTFSFTYDTAGTFKYHCAIHSQMTGSVTVTE